ncbi:type 1 glutamine amidotransferase [Leucobacter sp. wl10]|uniref:type 1 glutamine amidotransferase n=1 Tax=Leucobacter sp. wl10 TaxID=2304677 RepID=UPI0013C2F6EC|nr:type 1 glutamine amidotransferase [Leucobacter sp. wl10]
MNRLLVVQHEADAGIGQFAARLASVDLAVETVGAATRRAVPASLDGFDALIVLGGAPQPTDDDAAPWLPRVRSLVADAIDREAPYLGVCLGAQVLAVVAGGTVAPARVRPEVGLTDIVLDPEAKGDPLFGGLPERVRAVEWHFDEVIELPDGAVRLGGSEACEHQAFRLGTHAWGVQFHPELLSEGLSRWVRDSPDSLRRAGLSADQVLELVASKDRYLQAVWGAFFDRWVHLAARADGSPALPRRHSARSEERAQSQNPVRSDPATRKLAQDDV